MEPNQLLLPLSLLIHSATHLSRAHIWSTIGHNDDAQKARHSSIVLTIVQFRAENAFKNHHVACGMEIVRKGRQRMKSRGRQDIIVFAVRNVRQCI